MALNLNVQSSMKWRKKIVQQVLGDRCKEETSIFKNTVDLVVKRIFQCLQKYLTVKKD